MPKAAHTPTTSRRMLIAGIPLATLGFAAAAAPRSDDAALIEAAARFLHLDRRAGALPSGIGCSRAFNARVEAVLDRLIDQQQACVDVVIDQAARSPAGLRAKAVVVDRYLETCKVAGFAPSVDQMLVASLLKDVLACPA